MRQIVTAMLIVFLSGYAFKDWYKTLCGAIVMMAVMEHPDMPRSIMGIPGLNYQNWLFLLIFLSFLLNKQSEKLSFKPPNVDNFFIILYCCVVLVSFFRMMFDLDTLLYYQKLTGVNLFATDNAALLNTYLLSFKWMLPGLLLFYGCNSRERFLFAQTAMALMIFLLAFQVIKHMPLSLVTNVNKLSKGALKLDRWTGYHRVELAMMLSAGVWIYIFLTRIFTKKLQQIVLYASSGIAGLGLLLTGGRGGYLGCVVLALFFGVVKWRKILLLLPIVVMLSVALIPAVRDRVFTGIHNDPWAAEKLNEDELTAGRAGAWKLVIAQIWKRPVIGFGRLAVHRTGASLKGKEENGEFFGHPHCAYLEFLLDNGVIGLGVVLIMYLVLLKKGLFLFRSANIIAVVAGGTGLAFMIGQLISSITAQTFYPKEDAMLLWCAIGLMLRVYVEINEQASVGPPFLECKDNASWVLQK